MKISACVIVKNEEKNLPHWLSQMQALADEIIVVDTGSNDKSVQLALEAGAKVYNYQWQGDFSAAKNYAIDRATGDWIIFLDADEYFPDDVAPKVRKILLKHFYNNQVAALICTLINIDKDNHDRVINNMTQVRIFRRLPEIRYYGKVHERIANKGKNKLMLLEGELRILHTGYSRSILQEKARRNLPLLLAEEKSGVVKEKGRLYSQLMDCYNSLGEYERAIFYAGKAIEENVQQIGNAGYEYEVMISAMDALGIKGEELFAVIDEAREKYPKAEIFQFLKGLCLFDVESLWESKDALEKGFILRKKKEADLAKGKCLLDSALRIMPGAYGCYGELLYKFGDIVKAEEMYKRALEYNKYHPTALRGIYRCINKKTPEEQIEILSSWYNREKDGPYIYEALWDMLNPKLAAYYARERQGEADLFLRLGHYQAAGIKSMDNIHLLSEILTARMIITAEADKLEAVNPYLGTIRNILPKEYGQVIFNDGNIPETPARQATYRILAQLKEKKQAQAYE